jgi:2-phosphoglycerate kinase
MIDKRKLLFIGGVSHVGKSTIAQSILDCVGDSFGYNYISTDKLARHPGRPWQPQLTDIPKHVIEHYQFLTADELVENVLNHYHTNVWPRVDDIVTAHVTNISSGQIAIEGSALLPELVNNLNFENTASLWFTASNEFLKKRIYLSSQYEIKSPFERMLIDKFWKRNCLLNERIIADIDRLGLVSLNIEAASAVDELKACIDRHLSIQIDESWLY